MLPEGQTSGCVRRSDETILSNYYIKKHHKTHKTKARKRAIPPSKEKRETPCMRRGASCFYSLFFCADDYVALIGDPHDFLTVVAQRFYIGNHIFGDFFTRTDEWYARRIWD